MTKAGDAWERLFDEFEIQAHIDSAGFYDIKAEQFRKLHFEPRLLTKFDHSHQVPPAMRESNLGVLTLSSTTWRIGPFDVFGSLPEWTLPDRSVKRFRLPGWIESLSASQITGEGALVNAAAASGMLDEFFGEETIATVSGKGRSGSFDFRIDNHDDSKTFVEVRSAQIEVDAGFEGQEALYLIEAKKHLASDFNIRQLYYPFRTWTNRVRKPVRPVFITLANDVFDVTEFAFSQVDNFSSLERIRSHRYMFNTERISEKDLVEMAKSLATSYFPSTERKVPFPQADDFERVIDMLEFVATEPRTSDSIAQNYAFHPRQADYYFSAVRYLGLGDVVRGSDGLNYRQLNSLGVAVAAMSFSEKRKSLARLLLSIDPVRELYLKMMNSGHEPSRREAEQLVSELALGEGISGATIPRRAQTLVAWVKWLREIAR